MYKEVVMATLIRIIGLLILVGGIVVFWFGFNSSQKVPEKGLEKVTGRYSDGTMKYIVGGILMVVGGLAISLNCNRFCKK